MKTRRIYYVLAVIVLLGLAFWIYREQIVVLG